MALTNVANWVRTAGVVGAFAAANVVVVGTGHAQASCNATQDVVVAVDFGALGDGVQARCEGQVPESGTKALIDAGFTLTGTKQSGLDAVCRINDKPAPSREKCEKFPPANAYWSYWVGDAKTGKWTMSQTGAAQAHPGIGRVEGWSFGAGKPPTISASKAVQQATKPPERQSAENEKSSVPTGLLWGAGAIVLLLIAALIARSRRKRA